MLVITSSNEGTQRERIYTSDDYGTLKKNINEQSVKIHIHECFKNAKKIQEHLHIKIWHRVNLKRAYSVWWHCLTLNTYSEQISIKNPKIVYKN